MEPRTSYIICTNPRSGSWLLAEGLAATGCAGRPLEWFNEATEEEERQHCQMPPLTGAVYGSYLNWIKRVGTSANGVFGLKLMHYQFVQLPQKFSAFPAFAGMAAANILATAFANVKHLWLTRRDKVRQAISHYRACQTDQWWRIEGACKPKRPGAVEAPRFDAQAIAQFERQAIRNDLAWERYFQQGVITPLVVAYEDVVADYVGAIRHILRWLEVSNADTVPIASSRLNKQADATTEEWVRLYLMSKKDASSVARTVSIGSDGGHSSLSPSASASVDQWRQRASILFGQGRHEEARTCLEQALSAQPDDAALCNNLGVVLAERGHHEEALGYYERALQQQPHYAHAQHNRGNVLRRLGRLDEAVASYEEALRLEPQAADTCNNLGIALLALSRAEQAAQAFRRALQCRPDHVEARGNLGVALSEQGRLAEAAALYQQVLSRQPRSAQMHNNLGVALAGQGQSAEAIALYRRALQLTPDYPEAYNNLGNALRQQGELTAAAEALQQALRLKPDYAEAYNNLAIVHVRQGEVASALCGYAEALRWKADYPEAHVNRALAWLVQGDFAQGWPEYEWRWRGKEFRPRSFVQPRWDGSPLEGRTILLYAEQGLGDTLQFIRYAPLVRQRGGVVLAEAPPPLVPLLRSCPGIDQLVPTGSALPDFDVQAPLLSLPNLLHTTLETVPTDAPYLSADAALVERWGQELRGLDGFKIGIAWQGSPTYRDDRQRSIPLYHFAALARLPGVRLVSLQKGYGREQLTAAREWNVVDLADRLDESGGAFMDTAAVMRHLDLVITSDTAIAHLAGALAVPVWVILAAAGDWRWLLARADSPWYPTMRLFRQRRLGDWDEVFARVAEELRRQRPSAGDPLPLTNGAMSAASLRKQGRRLCEEGRYAEAVGCLRRALQLGPLSAPTCNNLGVALVRLGQLAEAASVYRQALSLRPAYAEAQHNLGEALQRLGRLAEARACYEEALRLKPGLAQTHNNLGVVLGAQGDLRAACAHYRQALQGQTDFALAHYNLAAALEKLGEHRTAVDHYEHALDRRHASAADYLRLGAERLRQSQYAEAVAAFRLALRRQPEDVPTQLHLGRALLQQGEAEEAAVCLQEALRQRPEDVEVLLNLGDAWRRLGRLPGAEDCYRQALRQRPRSAPLHNHLGITLIEQSRPAEAETCFRDSIRCQADHAPAHNNLGVALEQQGRLDEALPAYQESIRLDPNQADTHKNLALARLLTGDFARGWAEYEWRWKCVKAGRRSFTQPRWDGSPLEGRTILLHAEQGLGDTLQFIRYAPLVRQRGGVVLAEVQPPLVPLLRSCPGIDQLLPAGAALPDFDVQAPLLSLPNLLHTTLETAPADVPYLSADPALVARWGQELGGLDDFKIGIAWQGSRKYAGDKHRSLPLRHFAALARLPGVRLVSLQKGYGHEQLAAVAKDWNVVDWADRLDESGGAFMDTAAVMRHLDLIVSSDTALVHLAGALAAPIWVVLPVARDWRWLLEREDSPWYPTLRLFRQKRFGDWDEVFARVAAAVQARQSQAAPPLLVEVAAGELLDKITILDIKSKRLTDPMQRRNVNRERELLQAARLRSLREPAEVAEWLRQLRDINERLWEVEDALRGWEKRRDFGSDFIALARSVYQLNDRRAECKRRINVACGSSLIEEKSYAGAAAVETPASTPPCSQDRRGDGV